MARVRLGTRQSLLAQTQSRWVADQLRRANPGLEIEFVLITTSGDRASDVTPAKAGVQSNDLDSGVRRNDGPAGGLKALFTKEIEEALLENRIDLAVHSMKDMPGELPPGLIIGAVPAREDPRDVWISREGIAFKDLRRGARVATGAVRRQAQLRQHRPDLELVSLRGNVDTRLRKLREENFDGIILAAAGLRRLGRYAEATEALPTELLLPAVGQGALAIEIRAGDQEASAPYLAAIDHSATRHAVQAERGFLSALGGSCQTPIAAFAQVSQNELRLQGLVAARDGRQVLRGESQGPLSEAEAIGRRLAQTLLDQGAQDLLA